MSEDEGPPPVQDAHKKPRRPLSHQSGGVNNANAATKRVDPRFDPMLGRADTRHFEQNYKFLREEQEKEEAARRFRMKCLKCIIRRCELEEAGADLEEYDLSDYEQEVFGEDHQRELREMKRTPPQLLYRELEQLQRASQLYVTRTRDSSARDRHAKVKKELLKKEVQAVKAGTKSKPYFPKRAEVKKAMLADTFTHLNEKGGKAAVDRYLIRKRKK
ncbi:rRNA biogenesis protein RRP36 [Lotmaria passim]